MKRGIIVQGGEAIKDQHLGRKQWRFKERLLIVIRMEIEWQL